MQKLTIQFDIADPSGGSADEAQHIANIANDLAFLRTRHAELVRLAKVADATVQAFGHWLDWWANSPHKQPSLVYAAWDKVREDNGWHEQALAKALEEEK